MEQAARHLLFDSDTVQVEEEVEAPREAGQQQQQQQQQNNHGSTTSS
jgi:hypothetical protein